MTDATDATSGTTDSATRRAILEAFARALNREAHNLRQWPDLLWQQLYNRLQWDGNSVDARLERERQRQAALGRSPWVRTRTRIRESEGLHRVLAGHTSRVNACAWSPNGAQVLSAGDDGTVRIWDPSSGAERNVLTGHTAAVKVLAVSPDGAQVLSVSDDGTVRIWDLAAGTEGHVLPRRDVWEACAWSPDATWVVTVGLVSGTRIWSTVTGTERFDLSGGRGLVQCCAVSPNGAWVASGNMDLKGGTLWISDAVTGAERYAVSIPTHTVAVCAWSPDGTRLIIGDEKGSLVAIVFQVESGVGAVNIGPGFPVTRCAWSPDGTGIASGYSDGTLRLWGATDGAEAHVLEGHTDSVRDCAWSPDGAWLASVSDEGTLRIWDAATGAERHVLEHNRVLIHPVSACAWSPDGASVVTASDDGALCIWDAIGGARHHVLFCYDTAVLIEAFQRLHARKNEPFATADEDEPDVMEEIRLHDCAWSPDGASIASAGEDTTVQIWDVASGSRRHVFEAPVGVRNPGAHTAAVRGCAWSPDGASLASVGDDAQLIIWDPVAGSARHLLRGTTPMAWSPSGADVVAGGVTGGYRHDHTLSIWAAATGTQRYALEGHTDRVTACAWSPDGLRIVSASKDATLRIWDVTSGTERHVLEGHTGPVHACAWSPDGAWVVSASDDGTLRIWDGSSGHSVLTMLVVGKPTCMALHPSMPVLAAGDAGGTVYLVDLVGIEYGPIIVTAVDFGNGPVIRCPACVQLLPLQDGWLGQEVTCPREGCNGWMKVNPFIAGRSLGRSSP